MTIEISETTVILLALAFLGSMWVYVWRMSSIQIDRIQLQREQLEFERIDNVKIPFATHSDSLNAVVKTIIDALTLVRMEIADRERLKSKDITLNGFDIPNPVKSTNEQKDIPKVSKPILHEKTHINNGSLFKYD